VNKIVINTINNEFFDMYHSVQQMGRKCVLSLQYNEKVVCVPIVPYKREYGDPNVGQKGIALR
jgi:hypothetical protein